MSAQVTAELTGTVLQVLVAVGDAVEAGQTVALIESMKMEMPVTATSAGTVTEVSVADNDAVEAGDVIVTVE